MNYVRFLGGTRLGTGFPTRRLFRVLAHSRGSKMVKERSEKKMDGGKRRKRLRSILVEEAQKRYVSVEQLDINAMVRDTSIEVYLSLVGKGEVPLKELKKGIGKGPITMAAIGWLMKEGKILVKVTEDSIKVMVK